MAEPRRIALETDRITNVEKKTVEVPQTLRFSLSLSESNERTCPEISYPDLVKNASGDPKEKDPFGLGEEDDHDQLTALARKLEEKYNPGPRLGMGSKKGKRKKVGKLEDFMDLGLGYDENDSFVDNTEAYDELVPSTLTTQHGGFYINSGELKFRDVNSNSDDDADIHDLEKKKRGRRKRLAKDGIDKERRRKRLALGTKDGELIPRKKRIDPLAKSALNPKKKIQHTVANLIQQREKARQTVLTTAASTSTGPFSNNGSGDNSALNGQLAHYSLSDDSLSPNSGRQNMNSGITEAIESVINASLEAAPTEAEAGNDGNAGVGSPLTAPKLPSPLPSDLEVLVQQIKQAAQQSEEGKCKFFTPAVNNMLLTIEMQSHDLICHQRSGLYAHLGAHLPCSKETLMKRAKRLRLDKENGKLKEPMLKLKEAINHVMPQLLDKYNLECQATIQARLPSEKETEDSNDADSSDSDEEEKPEQTADEKSKRLVPRKRFQWNDDIRSLLCDVVKIKMNCFELLKSRVPTAEEYLKQFLEAEVKDLWPKGWMQARILFKQSRVVHAAYTSFFPRPKKLTALPKKLLPPSIQPGVTLPKLATIISAVVPTNVIITKSATMTPTVIPPSITTPKPATMTPAVVPPSIAALKVVTTTSVVISPVIVTPKLVSIMTAPVTTTSSAATTTVSITATTATTTTTSPIFILSPTSSCSGNSANFFRSMLTASYASPISNTLSTTTITSTNSAISPSMLTTTLSSTSTQSTTLVSRSLPILSTTVYANPIAAPKNMPSQTQSTQPLKNIPCPISLASVPKNLPSSTQSISAPAVSLLMSKNCSATVFTSSVPLSRNSPITTFATSSSSVPKNSPSSLNPLISSTSRSLLTSEKSAITNTLICNTKTTPTTTTSPSSLEYMSRLMSGVHYLPSTDSFSKLPASANIMRFASSAAQSGMSSGSSLLQTQQQTSSHPATTRPVTSPQDKLLKSKSISQDSLFPKSKGNSPCQDQSIKPKIASSIPSTQPSLLTNINSYKPEQEKNLTKFLSNKPQQTSSSEGTKLPSHSVRPAPTSLSDVVSSTVTSQNYVSTPSSYLSHNSAPSTSSPNQHKSPSHSSSGINLGLSTNHATLADLATQAEQAYPAHFQTSPIKTEACQRSTQGQSTQWSSPIYMNKLLSPVASPLPGYQSLSLPDLTKSSNSSVRPLNSHSILLPSSDAIITGPAPGTFTHGQTFQYRGFAES